MRQNEKEKREEESSSAEKYLLINKIIEAEWASLVSQMVKSLPANPGDAVSIPGLGRSPGGEHGNSL